MRTWPAGRPVYDTVKRFYVNGITQLPQLNRVVAPPIRKWLGEFAPEAKFFTCKLWNLINKGLERDSISTCEELRETVKAADIHGIKYSEFVSSGVVVRSSGKVDFEHGFRNT